MVQRKTLRVLILLLGAAAGCAAPIIALLLDNASIDFGKRSEHLVRVAFLPSNGRASWLTLTGSSGRSVECGLLLPIDTTRRLPAVILLGGNATGKHAVEYVSGFDSVLVVAVDYPYQPRSSYTLTEAAADLPAIRTALLGMVPSVQLVLDHLSLRSDVDTSRIILVGYSFGAPFVPVIASHDRRIDAAVMVYGGGGLRSLIRHNVRRYEGAVFSELIGLAGALLLDPLEPLDHAAAVAPTPVLMINGTEDEQIPAANAERLFRAVREPKRQVWLRSRHVNPGNPDLTRRIAEILRQEVNGMGGKLH